MVNETNISKGKAPMAKNTHRWIPIQKYERYREA
jgi:hypothetical protein